MCKWGWVSQYKSCKMVEMLLLLLWFCVINKPKLSEVNNDVQIRIIVMIHDFICSILSLQVVLSPTLVGLCVFLSVGNIMEKPLRDWVQEARPEDGILSPETPKSKKITDNSLIISECLNSWSHLKGFRWKSTNTDARRMILSTSWDQIWVIPWRRFVLSECADWSTAAWRGQAPSCMWFSTFYCIYSLMVKLKCNIWSLISWSQPPDKLKSSHI